MQRPVSTKNAEHYIWGGTCEGWHLLKHPGLSVIQERVPPGGREVPHYHRYAQQFFYVLAGEAIIELAEGIVRLAPGQGYAVTAGVRHQLRNEGETTLEFLVISAPHAHGDRVLADR